MNPSDARLGRLARHPLTLALALAAVALAARLLPGERMIDDAYITFRYARNLLNGLGFVYNPGEPVLGTTTPVYTLLLAGLALLFGTDNFPRLAVSVNALADAATCALLPTLGLRLSGRRAVGAAAGLIWAVAPMSVSFAVGGMETSVFILIMIALFTVYLAPRPRPGRARDLAAPLLCALALLTRPDAAIFVGPLGLDLIARRLYEVARKKKEGARPWGAGHPASDVRLRGDGASAAWRGLLGAGAAFLIPLAVWGLFAWQFFGSPLPHSIAAKAVAYRLPPEAATVRLIQHYGAPFFEYVFLGRYWPLAGFFVYFGVYLLGAAQSLRRDSRAWPLLLYPAAYFTVFSAANPLIFRWYLAPPLPMYYLGLFAGLARLSVDLSAWQAGRGNAPGTRRKGQDASSRSQAARLKPRVSGRGTGEALRNAPNEAHVTATESTSFYSLPAALLFVLPAAFFLFTSLAEWRLRPDHGPARPAPDMAWHQLELIYERIGRDLAGRVPAGGTVAAGDVGALGYFSGARILDTVGLMSPEASAYYPLPQADYAINYAIATDLILDRRPDYVVFLEAYGRNTLLRDARFSAAYRLVEVIPTDIYGSEGMMVWHVRE